MDKLGDPEKEFIDKLIRHLNAIKVALEKLKEEKWKTSEKKT